MALALLVFVPSATDSCMSRYSSLQPPALFAASDLPSKHHPYSRGSEGHLGNPGEPRSRDGGGQQQLGAAKAANNDLRNKKSFLRNEAAR